MSNLLINPVNLAWGTSNAALGATLGGASFALSGAVWLGSEFAKLGESFGTPAEISAALLGAGTGAAGGFVVGSVLGALSGQQMVELLVPYSSQVLPPAPANLAQAF